MELKINMTSKKFIDLVVCGPDMSGTSTQIKDIFNFLINQGNSVRDLRGTETNALFHAEAFQGLTKGYTSINELPIKLRKEFLLKVNELMSGGGTNQDLQVASMIKTNFTTYVNPNLADAWIMEEPTKRGAGQVNRVIEQNRSDFGGRMNPVAAALAHQAYRTDEAIRFRLQLRKEGKIILRSRSEESACYQIKDKSFLPEGIKKKDYLNLPGHKIAFRYPPTHLFVICAPKKWTTKDYLELKQERSDGRAIDDHEKDANYQVLVNKRYSSNWLEKLYMEGCKLHGGKVPIIKRFSIHDSKEEIREKMNQEIKKILEEN
jgi:hypothetical protein